MFSFDKFGRAALQSSLLWGALLSLLAYLGLEFGQSLLPTAVTEFVVGRWDVYVCAVMFLIGIAAIVIKAVQLGINWYCVYRLNLGAVPAGEASAATINATIKELDIQLPYCRSAYLYRRLKEAFEFAVRKRGQEPIDAHLRYLADLDAARMNTSYGVPRFLCWAIPATGSLAAVLAIATAVGQLATPPAENVAATATAESATTAEAAPSTPAPAEVLSGVTGGLSVAFQVMALAIGLSIVLMVLKFVCEHAEAHLLDAVEERAAREVIARCGSLTASAATPQDQLRQLADRLGALTEKLAQLPAGGGAVGTGAAPSTEQIESIVSRAMAKAVAAQPQAVVAGGGQFTDMSQVQDALKQIAAFFSIQQAEHQQESEIVRQLSEIIQEGENANWKPRKEKESMASSLAGLWNALSD